MNWKTFLFGTMIIVAWYGGYKGYGFKQTPEIKNIEPQSALEACWTVCYEQQVNTIKEAFNAEMLQHKQAQSLLRGMEIICRGQCKDRLGIE